VSGKEGACLKDAPMPRWTLIVALAAGLTLPVSADAAPVLMISIDGLRPLDVIEADQRGVDVPNLRAIMQGGTYSTGVRNSLPTVTYPNHTTLITGVWPAKHGIANNTTFDPERKNMGGWYWYASDIKVPTLWEAVHKAGGKTASLGWPVSVDATSIDYDIPEYWRARIPEDLKLVHALATRGLPEAIKAKSGVDLSEVFSTLPPSDIAKGKMAAALYALYRPQFMTLHLSSLDETEHDTGPGSPESKTDLKLIDGVVGDLVAQARAAEPDLVVMVVSDHGFAKLEHEVDLVQDFVDAGLITVDPKTRKVTAWAAAPWGGASAAVVLKDPKDQAVKAKVKALLDRLTADPANGINRVIDAEEIARMGGTGMASYWVDFKIGYAMGGGMTHISPATEKGTHGWFPDHPEMRASFFASGPGVPRKGAIGEIDQRDIAPTVAAMLHVDLPSADGKPLF
jgi:predicted AlkP superfamily pyrophosphatase or phosphodiesterase